MQEAVQHKVWSRPVDGIRRDGIAAAGPQPYCCRTSPSPSSRASALCFQPYSAALAHNAQLPSSHPCLPLLQRCRGGCHPLPSARLVQSQPTPAALARRCAALRRCSQTTITVTAAQRQWRWQQQQLVTHQQQYAVTLLHFSHTHHFHCLHQQNAPSRHRPLYLHRTRHWPRSGCRSVHTAFG